MAVKSWNRSSENRSSGLQSKNRNYSIYIQYIIKCLCSVIVLCGMMMKGRRWSPVPAHSLLFSKITKRAARFNVPIRRTNRYQQYYMPSQHTYCVGVAIRKCTSPPLLATRLKIFKLKFTTPPRIEPRTCWPRGRHATIWANAASCYNRDNWIYI